MPDNLVFITQPTNGLLNTNLTPDVQVQVQDSATLLPDLAAIGSSITVTASPGGQMFTAVIGASAIATFTGASAVNMSTANIFQLTATTTYGGPMNPGPFVSDAYQIFDTASQATQLIFSVQPTDTIKNSPISPSVQVTIADSSSNTVTANAVITITNNLSGQIFTASAVNGVAVFSGGSAVDINTAGTCILTATTSPTAPPPALTGTSNSFTVYAATKYAFLNSPTNTLTNATVLPTPSSPAGIRVVIRNIFNATVPVDNVVVTITVNGTGQVFTASTVAGIASFTNITVNSPGSRSLTASGFSLTTATSSSFTVTTAASLTFTQQPADTIVNNRIVTNTNLPVRVEVRDGSNVLIPVNGVQLDITVNSQTYSATTVAGAADFSDISVSAAGNFSLVVNANQVGVAPSGLSSSFNVFNATLSITNPPPNIINDYPFNVNVQIRNAAGTSVLSTVSATIILEIKQGATTIGVAVAQFTSSGATTFSSQSISAAGTYTLKASVGTISPATISLTTSSSSFTVFEASQIVFTQQPSNTLVGTTLAPVTVAVLDGSGSTLPVTVAVDITSSVGPPSGTLTVNTVSGVATFSTLSFGSANAGVTLTASITLIGPPLSSLPSTTFDILLADNLFFTQQPSNTSVGRPIIPAPAVAVRSGSVVLDVSVPVTVTVNSQTFVATSVNGIATFPTITISAAGTFTLSPSVSPPLGSMPPSSPFQVAATPTTPETPDLKKYKLTAVVITDLAGNTVDIVATGGILPPTINTYVVAGTYQNNLPTLLDNAAVAFHMDVNGRLIVSSGDIVGDAIESQPLSLGLEPITFGSLLPVLADGAAQRIRGSRSGVLYTTLTDDVGSAGVTVGQHNGTPLSAPAVGLVVGGQYTASLTTLSDNSPFVMHSDVNGRLLVSPDLNGTGTDESTAPTTPVGFFITTKYTSTLPTLTANDAVVLHADANGRLLISPDLNGIGINASAAPTNPVGMFGVAKYTNTLTTYTNNNATVFHSDAKGRLLVSPDLNGVGTDAATAPTTATGFFVVAKYLGTLPLYTTGTSSIFHTDRRGRMLASMSPGLTGTPPSLTSVGASVVNITLLASNPDRLGATIYNDGTAGNIYLRYGASASPTTFTVKITPGTVYELPFPVYTGQIDAVWDVAPVGEFARITELT